MDVDAGLNGWDRCRDEWMGCRCGDGCRCRNDVDAGTVGMDVDAGTDGMDVDAGTGTDGMDVDVGWM